MKKLAPNLENIVLNEQVYIDDPFPYGIARIT